MSLPSTSAGPRMYLVVPSTEQVTIALSGSSAMASTCLGSVQSSAVELRLDRRGDLGQVARGPGGTVRAGRARSRRAGGGTGALVAGALAAGVGGACGRDWGVAVGVGVVADGARSACGKADPAEVRGRAGRLGGRLRGRGRLGGRRSPSPAALADGVAEGWRSVPGRARCSAPGPAPGGSAAGRTCSASRPCSGRGLPGSETTMLRPPWVVTSASATPVPSTRWRMMSTALSIWPWLIGRLPDDRARGRSGCRPRGRGRAWGSTAPSAQVCTRGEDAVEDDDDDAAARRGRRGGRAACGGRWPRRRSLLGVRGRRGRSAVARGASCGAGRSGRRRPASARRSTADPRQSGRLTSRTAMRSSSATIRPQQSRRWW